ncbi:hypothetical protein SAICODRAFT_71951 [Saitoella complicata NRRL Y-17804]|uniref:uncharacterized protein n=1 Tax=Saitoella complicata (strain BCRC 22490 / CBS 7301 / JCM 7358 / NBRC 10748 / NRRL Y-17804) TaxID=698492 RepID=UPI000867371E|nr:uncharacterized protein SAICODRAFT_71951 [Saitoella complicata NRRL Y-17804]ODQ52401.1 hypothetical protein SAICODRAFT_71951 [Saitoella complicata NRRL Y-17804]
MASTASTTMSALSEGLLLYKEDPTFDNAITYTTVIDAHLSDAARYTVDEQREILSVLHNILAAEENHALVETIAWDLVAILQPYLTTHPDLAASCLLALASYGAPKEVFLKLVEVHDLGVEPNSASAVATALETCYNRIQAKKPSRFLASYGAAILGMYAQAPVTNYNIASAFMSNIALRMKESEQTMPEDALIQQRLLQAFGTHAIEAFIRSFEHGTASTKDEDTDEEDEVLRSKRGLQLAERFRATHTHPSLRKLDSVSHTDGVDDHVELVNGDLNGLLREVSTVMQLTPEQLWEELPIILGKTYLEESSDEEQDDDVPDVPSAIPLSLTGTIILLAWRTFHERPLRPSSLKEYFEIHMNAAFALSKAHVVNPETLDALLFLGAWITIEMTTNALQDIEPERFLEYIHVFAAISATSPDSNVRYLSHTLVARCIHLHRPDVRLMYIMDTFESCPFEAVRAATVGILKDEILAAIDGEATGSSLLASPFLLTAIGPVIFSIDEEVLSRPQLLQDKSGFLMQALNLYLLLLKKGGEDKLGIRSPTQLKAMEEKWLKPLFVAISDWLSEDKDSEFQVSLLQDALERVNMAHEVAVAAEVSLR